MKERSLFIQKFERIAREDPRILSAFLGGSLADGTEDDFSDIDIYYILDEQSYSDFPSQMRTRLSEMGPLVFLEQHNNFGFDLILFIFQNGSTASSSPSKHHSKEKISKDTSKNNYAGIGTGTTSSSPLLLGEGSGQRSPNSSR